MPKPRNYFESKITRIKGALCKIADKNGTGLYVYDESEAKRNISRFRKAFRGAGIDPSIYFAIKSNPYPGLLRTVTKEGGFLDASSPHELSLALGAKPKRFIYTGPGKTIDDFRKLLPHSKRATIHLESFTELKRLGELAASKKTVMRCGVRVSTSQHKKWAKFGIPLDELGKFWREARRYKYLSLEGTHFHLSWQATSKPTVLALEEVGSKIRKTFPKSSYQELRFVDVGGGILPETADRIYPWNRKEVFDWDLIPKCLPKILKDGYLPRSVAQSFTPVEKFAKEVCGAFKSEIQSLSPEAELWTEPGRFISDSVMHVLLRVTDKKRRNMVIVDGGNNIIGWEKHEFLTYTPVYNLSRFSTSRERPCLVYGSLCTPDDIWGYYVRGNGVEIDDVLCMPFQGAYTYTLRQSFIRGEPQVVDLKSRI